jgi:hypothetical protein
MINDKVMIGPYLGEFGHELFSWQARWRHIVTVDKSYNEAYVICSPDKALLYEDFAHVNVIPYSKRADGSAAPDIDAYGANIHLRKHGRRYPYLTSGFPQKFVKWGMPQADGAQVLFHARGREHVGHKNWPAAKFIELYHWLRAQGISVACVGLSKATLDLPEEIPSHRDISLDQLVDVLSSALCIVGTSSGTMHLASLCGCPQVVFAPTHDLHRRYLTGWNPFGTSVYRSGTWFPEVDEAKALVDMALEAAK